MINGLQILWLKCLKERINMAKEYSLKPAIRQPSVVPYLLNGESAPAILEDYNQLVDSDFQGNSNLKVLELKDVNKTPTIVGSNSLVLPVVQRLIPGRRIGRPEDLQRTLNDGDTLSIRGNHYVDLGLVLDFSGRNHEMALDFYQQLSKELQGFEGLPAVVVGYDIKNFDRGNYNLGLVRTDKTQVRHSPILTGKSGKFSHKDVSLETGLPSKLEGGDRTLYTVSQNAKSLDNIGLSGVYLNGVLIVNSGNDDLARMTVVG